MAQVRESVEVDAPQQVVWDALSAWERQGDWMLLTQVRPTLRDGQGAGAGVEAWTGIGPLGFLDVMEVRVWEPPHRIVTRHLGRVVRGAGSMEVVDLGGGRSCFTMSEWLDLPLGILGRLGWPLVRPVARVGLRLSLRRFKRQVEALATQRAG